MLKIILNVGFDSEEIYCIMEDFNEAMFKTKVDNIFRMEGLYENLQTM